MSLYSRLFVISSLFYLLIGACMGIGMAILPAWKMVLHFPHAHTMVIGWTSMMIFGLAYHVIPRFSGSPLIHECYQKLHWWLANSGMIGMIIVPIFQVYFYSWADLWDSLFFCFGFLQFSGILIFVFQILMALKFFSRSCSASKSCCSPCGENAKLK